MDEKLEDLIYKILENAPYPVYSGWYKQDLNKKTHTTFLCATGSFNYSEDEAEECTLIFSFDTWSGDKKEAIEQLKYIRKALKEYGFCLSDYNEDYETDTELYHLTDRYSYLINDIYE